jgi:hypothetical protein
MRRQRGDVQAHYLQGIWRFSWINLDFAGSPIWEADVLPLNYSRILFAINNLPQIASSPARPSLRLCLLASHPRGRLAIKPRSCPAGTCPQRKAIVQPPGAEA